MLKMSDTRRALGNRGETLAAQKLQSLGYTIHERNWRCAVGELDIVAEKDDMLIFVEVRTRRGDRFGTPEESITPAKRAKLIEVAWTYLDEHDAEDRNWRIDVVAVEVGSRGEVVRIDVLENAIEQ